MRTSFEKQQVRVLAVLTLVNFMNFVDRQIIGALVPLISADFLLTHSQAGLMGTVFALVHSVLTLPLGVVADRTSRKKVIGFGLVLWSGATFLSGLAASFRMLLASRAVVGMGEAAFTPAATAIITRSFPAELRARVQGVFDSGMFRGGCVGLGLGSAMGTWFGWRPSLFIVAIPGLLLAINVAMLREPKVRAADRRQVPLRDLLRIPAYVAALVAGCFITFAGYSFIFWGTSFVHSVKGFALEEAGLVLGANMIVAGVLGIVVGATLADRMARRVVWGRVFVITAGLLLGVPFLLWALHTPVKAHFIVFFFLGGFFMSWYHGPLTAVLHDLTPERAHATAMGLYQGVVHLIAVTTAPVVIGRVADRWGLLRGMDVAAGFYVVGALCFFVVLLLVRRHGAVARHAMSHAPDVAVARPVTASDAHPSGSIS